MGNAFYQGRSSFKLVFNDSCLEDGLTLAEAGVSACSTICITNTYEYTRFAGITEIDESEVRARDKYGNPLSHGVSCYDLVGDREMEGLSIVVLDCNEEQDIAEFGVLGVGARNALRRKGFELIIWGRGAVESDRKFPPTREELEEALGKACQLWIISGTQSRLSDELCTLAKVFFNEGHGLYIWGGEPYNTEANAVLMALFPGVTLSGNYCGTDEVLHEVETRGGPIATDASTPPTGFHKHFITTGLESMHAPVTAVAKITGQGVGFQDIMILSEGTVATTAYDEEQKRALVDGGYTRLFMNWDTAGTDRFVVNAAAWLSNIERFT